MPKLHALSGSCTPSPHKTLTTSCQPRLQVLAATPPCMPATGNKSTTPNETALFQILLRQQGPPLAKSLLVVSAAWSQHLAWQVVEGEQ